MVYYYSTRSPNLSNAELIRVDRQVMDPIQYGAFVSIAYYKLETGDIIGIVF